MKLEQIFEKCLKLSVGKRQDYVTKPGIDNHENFKRSAEIASWFKYDRDKSYVILIGTKLARLGSLLSKEEKPNNESIEDTFVDLINYCALWAERVSIVLEGPEKIESEITKYEFSLKTGKHLFSPKEGQPAFCSICELHHSSHSIYDPNT